jgi:release factor glutamine methyltransferase
LSRMKNSPPTDGPGMDLAALLQRFEGRIPSLPDKPEESTEAVLRALWLLAAGRPVSAVLASEQRLPELSAQEQERFYQLVAQREQGIPLAHLTGRQHFMGREFLAGKQALIPRRETEILGNAALALLRERVSTASPHPRVLDLCCGSGNLACTLAGEVAGCRVWAADLSPEAVELARANAIHLGCADRVQVVAGDLFSPFEGGEYDHSFDLICCNPPYITSARLETLPAEIVRNEPRMAFDAGPLGLGILSRLLQDAPRFLVAGGWLAFEVGVGQGEALLRRVEKQPQFAEARGAADSHGKIRAICCRRRP